MTLRCLLFGHRRSLSRATLDEKHGRWLSVCRRCHTMLVREAAGEWRPFTPPAGKLVPVKRTPAEEDLKFAQPRAEGAPLTAADETAAAVQEPDTRAAPSRNVSRGGTCAAAAQPKRRSPILVGKGQRRRAR